MSQQSEYITRRNLIKTLGLGAGSFILAGFDPDGTLAQTPEQTDLPKQATPTRGRPGFYRVAELKGKWTFLTPDDQPLYLRGLNHYGDGSHMPLNLAKKYGTVEAWRRSVRDRHDKWGFNFLPPSVGPSEPTDEVKPPVHNKFGGVRWQGDIRRTPEWPAEHFAELDYPFTAFLEVPRQYMAGLGLPDVFSRDFREMVDKRCREFVEPLKDNPNLIGYHYCQNPPWNPAIESFDFWLASITNGRDGKRAWAALMRRTYGSIEHWRDTYGLPLKSFQEVAGMQFPLRAYVNDSEGEKDKLAFMARGCEEYYKGYHDTIRKYDENHLILGDRNTLHLHSLPAYAIYRMKPYIDVLSINIMGPASTQFPVLQQVTRHWDGPILLGDTGAGVLHLDWPKSTYMCQDWDEFDRLYQSYMTSGIHHPQLVGFAWCGYYETPTSRSGLVDSRNDEPLPEMLSIMRKWNQWMEENYPKYVLD